MLCCAKLHYCTTEWKHVFRHTDGIFGTGTQSESLGEAGLEPLTIG